MTVTLQEFKEFVEAKPDLTTRIVRGSFSTVKQ
jgi:hypothetical protein